MAFFGTAELSKLRHAPLRRRTATERQRARNDVDCSWFAELYERTVSSVYRYAVVLVHDANLAEDVTAETYLRAWKGRRSYRGDGTALSWLLAIAHNVALSALRQRRETVALDRVDNRALDEEESDLSGPLAEHAREEELRGLLLRAIQLLTPEQQQVIYLRFFEGLSHQEIAERLGKRPGAVRAIQFRALARLRQRLQGEARHAS